MVKRTNCELSDFGLSQLVDKPTTHIKNHILDWVVVRGDKSLITFNDGQKYPSLSNHFAVVGHVAISRPTPGKRFVTSRNLRAVDLDHLRTYVAALTTIVKCYPTWTLRV